MVNQSIEGHPTAGDTGPDRRIMTVRAAVRHRTSRRTAPYDTSYGAVRRLVRYRTAARTVHVRHVIVRYRTLPRKVPYGGSYGAVRRLVRYRTMTCRTCTVRAAVQCRTRQRTIPYDYVSYMYRTSRRTIPYGSPYGTVRGKEAAAAASFPLSPLLDLI